MHCQDAIQHLKTRMKGVLDLHNVNGKVSWRLMEVHEHSDAKYLNGYCFKEHVRYANGRFPMACVGTLLTESYLRDAAGGQGGQASSIASLFVASATQALATKCCSPSSKSSQLLTRVEAASSSEAAEAFAAGASASASSDFDAASSSCGGVDGGSAIGSASAEPAVSAAAEEDAAASARREFAEERAFLIGATYGTASDEAGAPAVFLLMAVLLGRPRLRDSATMREADSCNEELPEPPPPPWEAPATSRSA